MTIPVSPNIALPPPPKPLGPVVPPFVQPAPSPAQPLDVITVPESLPPADGVSKIVHFTCTNGTWSVELKTLTPGAAFTDRDLNRLVNMLQVQRPNLRRLAYIDYMKQQREAADKLKAQPVPVISDKKV